MAAKKDVMLGFRRFEKSGDAAGYLNAMLRRYDVGHRVNAADAVMLEAALTRHPDADGMIGPGVNGFSVRAADFGSKCFCIDRMDGSAVRFAHKACVWST